MTSVGILIGLDFSLFTHLANTMTLDQEFWSYLIFPAPEGKVRLHVWLFAEVMGMDFFKNEDFSRKPLSLLKNI